MEKITIQLDSRWARRARSRLYWTVAALTPVVPLAVTNLALGSGESRHFLLHILVMVFCWAVFIIVFTFYVTLGRTVLAELRKLEDESGSA